ncbi:hypothetical protein MIMGU_mgv1a020552mg, partial [Erythranthe guttata]
MELLTAMAATNNTGNLKRKKEVHTEDLHVQHVTNASNDHTGIAVTSFNKLSYELEEPHVVQCIWKSFAKQYSSFRSNAHKYYLKWKEGGGVTLARQNIYEKLGDRRDDWLWLCDFWETTKFEKVSNTQKSNRKKLTYSHKLGTKSRAAHQHEKGFDDIDMYEVEYHNPKNGWAYKDFEANSVRMKELREQQRALPEGVDRMTTEEICITVLGENSSYAKSKGLNRKVSGVDAISSFEASSSRARLEEELANTQSELAKRANYETEGRNERKGKGKQGRWQRRMRHDL